MSPLIVPHAPARFFLTKALLILTTFSFLVLIFHVGAEKNLVRIVTANEWGRTLYAVSAAITQKKFGVGWFAVDEAIEGTLQRNGLTADPQTLAQIGLTYPDNFRNAAQLQMAIDKALALEVPSPKEDPNPLYPRLRGASGDDPAYSAYASLSFALFGAHLASMYYTYFLLVAVSLGLYIIAHKRSIPALVVANLGMTAFYLIVASELVSATPTQHFGTNELDIKDPRFLSTLAAVPILHLLMVFLHSSQRLHRYDYLALVVQSILFAFAIAVRASTVWAFIALGLWWLLFTARHLWQTGAVKPLWDLANPRSVYVMASVVAVVLISHLVVIFAEHPLYRAKGEISTHLFWQGLLYQQLSNPDWTVRYGASVNNKVGDDMPVEVAKIAIAKLPAAEQQRYLTRFGTPTISAAEEFSRERLFKMVRTDPHFVAQTYFIYVPILLARSISLFYSVLCAALSSTTICVMILWLALLAWLASRGGVNDPLIRKTAFTAGFMALMSLLPYWLISVNTALLVDFFFWSLFLVLVTSVACLSLIFRTLGSGGVALEFPPTA